jgi:hypothetical protein
MLIHLITATTRRLEFQYKVGDFPQSHLLLTPPTLPSTYPQGLLNTNSGETSYNARVRKSLYTDSPVSMQRCAWAKLHACMHAGEEEGGGEGGRN